MSRNPVDRFVSEKLGCKGVKGWPSALCRETTIVYQGYVGIMENEMETATYSIFGL